MFISFLEKTYFLRHLFILLAVFVQTVAVLMSEKEKKVAVLLQIVSAKICSEFNPLLSEWCLTEILSFLSTKEIIDSVWELNSFLRTFIDSGSNRKVTEFLISNEFGKSFLAAERQNAPARQDRPSKEGNQATKAVHRLKQLYNDWDHVHKTLVTMFNLNQVSKRCEQETDFSVFENFEHATFFIHWIKKVNLFVCFFCVVADERIIPSIIRSN